MANVAMRAFGYAYRRLRPFVPGGARYAGVVSCYDRPWSDDYVPRSWLPLEGVVGDEPEYEGALCRGLREHVRVGDRVVIVGAGIGVTAVVAAQCGGVVRCYEGSLEQVRLARKTIKRNR